MTSSPIVARWELSRRLDSLRKERGLDVKAITDHLDFSRNYWSAVINDRTLIAPDTLEKLLDLFELPDNERRQIMELRSTAKKHAWWDDYQRLGGDSKRICGLEDGASRIRVFEGQLIPGLLQIPLYTRALMKSDPKHSTLGTDEVVAARQRRQEVLTRDPPVAYEALLTEGALRQQPAGLEVQREQLHYIADLAEHPNADVTVRVIPFAADPGVILSASTLVFFDFEPTSHLSSISWQEAIRPLGFLEPGHEDFRHLEHAWTQGWKGSLNAEDSLQLLRRVATE
ncbi:MAG: Scr1 family TA system antitoxin-like transcriptional regulator [Actinomycetota bacterium]